MVLEKTLESPLRRSNQSILKEINPEYSLEGLMLKLKLQYFGHLMTHWKRLWCWEGLGAGGEGDNRGWDDWMASPTRWTWGWASLRSCWWTGRPGMLQSTGLQRVGQDWATELNWQFVSEAIWYRAYLLKGLWLLTQILHYSSAQIFYFFMI